MAAAASLSLEAFGDAHRRTEGRQDLHDRVDAWLNRLEAPMADRTPSLEEWTPAVLALRQELPQAVTEGRVAPAPRAMLEQHTATCPPCGPTWSARGLQERTVETLVGAVRLRRPSVDGLHGQQGPPPVAEALQGTACRKLPDVQKAAVQLTTEGPYATAGALFEPRPGWPLRAHSAPEVTPGVAAGRTGLAVAPRREERLATIAAEAAGQPWRPMLVLAIDGAAVPTRPDTAQGRRPGRTKVRATRARGTGEGRAAQGVRCDLSAEDRIVQVRSWHPVQTDEAAAAALRHVKAAGLIPEDEGRLWVMADGAPGIGKQAQAVFPSAVESLDHDPCRERLPKVAARQDGAHPERHREWGEAALARLFDGEVHGVIGGRQRMKPGAAPAAEESATLIAYLQRHQARLDDRFARKGGYPMGSGGIESANTCICHGRLKRSGAWWDVTNANQTLALRCAKYYGTFDRVFARYRQRLQDRSG